MQRGRRRRRKVRVSPISPGDGAARDHVGGRGQCGPRHFGPGGAHGKAGPGGLLRRLERPLQGYQVSSGLSPQCFRWACSVCAPCSPEGCASYFVGRFQGLGRSESGIDGLDDLLLGPLVHLILGLEHPAKLRQHVQAGIEARRVRPHIASLILPQQSHLATYAQSILNGANPNPDVDGLGGRHDPRAGRGRTEATGAAGTAHWSRPRRGTRQEVGLDQVDQRGISVDTYDSVDQRLMLYSLFVLTSHVVKRNDGIQ